MSGFGSFLQHVGRATPQAQQSYSYLDQIIQQQRQAALFKQVLQSLGQGQQGAPTSQVPGALIPQGVISPSQPGATPQPGGVSPAGGAAVPAAGGGAPVGAGPMPAAPPGGGGAPSLQPPQDMMARIVQLMGNAQGDPRAVQGAFQDLTKTFNPYDKMQDMLYGRMAGIQGQNDRANLAADTRIKTTGMQQEGANSRAAGIQAGQNERASEKNALTQNLAEQKWLMYGTKWSADREQKAEIAEQISRDRNKSIDERAKAAADASRLRAAALQEKAHEADQKSKDTRYSVDERAQAASDANNLKRAYLVEKTQMDEGTHRIRLKQEEERERHDAATEGQQATNEKGRNTREASRESAKWTLQEAMQKAKGQTNPKLANDLGYQKVRENFINATKVSVQDPTNEDKYKSQVAAAKAFNEYQLPGGASTGAPAASAPPDPSTLSDKEERSSDGGKTWWKLDGGKAVQVQ